MTYVNLNKIIHQVYRPVWRLVDAENHICGRLACNLCTILTGKYKPIYDPSNVEGGDHIVVINCRNVAYAKPTYNNKVYYSHSQYPGGLKKVTIQDLIKKDPCEPLRRAVYGMLPRNRLRRVFMSRLHLYPDGKHPHLGQIPLNTKPFIAAQKKPEGVDEWQTLQFPGIDKWPEDFGEVLYQFDTFEEGKKSEFDIIDFDKLHKEYMSKKSMNKKENDVSNKKKSKK